MLLNCIGETVTGLMNLCVKHVDGSWLTQVLLMLRSHRSVLQTLCAVVSHLTTRRAGTLSECHVHALAAMFVHWTKHDSCSAGIRVRLSSTPKAEVADSRPPFVAHVLESLPLSTTAEATFCLLFAMSYVAYAEMTGREPLSTENRTVAHRGRVVRRSDDELVVIPDLILRLMSYVGPKLVKRLRPNASSCGDSVLRGRFVSVERWLLSSGLVRSLVAENRMAFESWVWNEVRVDDDDDLECEWLSDYYHWVVFSRWHPPRSFSESAAGQSYIAVVLRLLAEALLDFDTRCGRQRLCSCEVAQGHRRLTQSGRHNIFNLLQASRLKFKSNQIYLYRQSPIAQ